MSLPARVLAFLLALAALAAGWWRLTAFYESRGYARARAEYQAAAELQREANRARARAAELQYSVQSAAREQFITEKREELRHVASNLAAIPLGADTVRLLNDAISCSISDRPAACVGADAVPDPGSTAVGGDSQ